MASTGHSNVYIPSLSIGQLDECGSEVNIKVGVLHIWDRQCHLLVKVNRGRNWLYILRLDIARPVCLSLQHEDEA